MAGDEMVRDPSLYSFRLDFVLCFGVMPVFWSCAPEIGQIWRRVGFLFILLMLWMLEIGATEWSIGVSFNKVVVCGA
jgi:hypothetical protein